MDLFGGRHVGAPEQSNGMISSSSGEPMVPRVLGPNVGRRVLSCNNRDDRRFRGFRLRLRSLAVSMEGNRWVLADGVTGHVQLHFIARRPFHVDDRDRDVAVAPEVSMIENEVGDLRVVVDEEAVDVSHLAIVAASHLAGASHLDRPWRYAVIGGAHH